MDKENLKKLIEHSIIRLRNGEQVEEGKLELKRQWLRFESTDPNSKKITESEFLKDLVSLANTPGTEGYLVYGIDQKTGEVFHSPFEQCGLKDIIDLRHLVVKFVDLPVDFELVELGLNIDGAGKTVSVLAIPPSLNKPHVITHYISSKGRQIDNFIPIRKSTGICPATRSDIEFMYYDRKNIEPEYALDIIAYKPRLVVNGSGDSIIVDFQLVFQNYGRKPIVIVESTMTIDPAPEKGIPNQLIFKLKRYNEHSVQNQESFLVARYLKIPANQAETLMVKYEGFGSNELVRSLREAKDISFSISAKDTFGKEYRSTIFIK